MKDAQGNLLGFRPDGMYLKLSGEDRLRQVFAIKGDKVSKYVSPANILKKANAIGFNYDGLKELLARGHKTIHVVIGKRQSIKLSIQSILDNKEFLWFKEQGFERQIFWKLDEA